MREARFQLGSTDAVEFLQALPDESVNLVVTDPPYESLEKHRAIGTTTRLKNSKASSNKWFQIFPNARFEELFAQVYRVLERNSHFYLFCDQETMFVAKPIGEQVGFKFWKPIIWDKCLAPETPVCTRRGVIPIAEVTTDDHVALPEGGYARVLARRETHRPSLRLSLSDGSELRCSTDHPFVLNDQRQVAASELRAGSALLRRQVRARRVARVDLAELIPEEQRVCELPDSSRCLWCDREFDSSRAAAAHQARFCESARSKQAMADDLGIKAKRLRRWMGQGKIPVTWARQLGIEDRLGARVQLYLQNDAERWHPQDVDLDYELGKVVGLYAAEGCAGGAGGVSFTLHAHEKHLHALIGRVARRCGVRALVACTDATAVVSVSFLLFGELMRHFVGGRTAPSKFFKPPVYGAPDDFRRGVFDGLQEGDGHWSHDEYRQTLNTSSHDLAMFALRFVNERGGQATIRRFENDHAGGWRVRYDPIKEAASLEVVAVEEIGELDLIDIAIDDPAHLYLLGNGVVTHNCKIGMGYHYRARYECILFFEKGKRKLNDLGISDIIEAPRVYRGYPAEKPPAVSEVLIGQSTEPGALVVDPFMGSGSAGVAAVTLGRDFLGNDICEEAVDIAAGRLVEAGATRADLLGTSVTSGAPQLGLGL